MERALVYTGWLASERQVDASSFFCEDELGDVDGNEIQRIDYGELRGTLFSPQ